MAKGQSLTLSRQGATVVKEDTSLEEIRGALGRVSAHDVAARRSWRGRLLTLLAIMGPGLIVMVGDNDAGGVSTYAQAGQDYGSALLWTLPLLIPVLIVNQEMVVRLGAVTGVGHARLIFERLGRVWGMFSVTDLFLLNFLTLVTEFIGVSLGAEYLGASPFLAVPAAALLLIATTVTGRFERWERFMFVFLAANALVIPLAVMSHPPAGETLHDLVVPRIPGGVSSTTFLLIIAIVGTTVTPWQLFFQQSNVVDKRITPRWLSYERADTVIGAFVVVIGAAALMLAAAHAFSGTSELGHFTDARGVAGGLRTYVGSPAGTIFAVVLIDASIIGASAVTLATSYAVGDVFGLHNSLHRSLREAPSFYAFFSGLIALSAALVLIPQAPLGLITTAVQAFAGVLLPGAIMVLLLLCNDTEILGPWVNTRWFNALASVIFGVLLVLSAILAIDTLIPGINVETLLIVFGALLAASFVGVIVVTLQRRPPPPYTGDRSTWRMPPAALLNRAVWSRSRLLGMSALRAYSVIAVVALLIKTIQIGTGH
ncbi:MAG TPA: NRAMP family divalent metal transporter [Candidatus Dormibacteraeota bacterium]|nr:NRAMP family divalent metal transporter [Candidatus Dormibacteraeota bacterium]